MGSFDTQVNEVGANIIFTPVLSCSNLVQFDNDSNLLGLQSSFRWILKPGSDLFLVVDKGWVRLDDRFQSESDRITVKLQYTFRL